MTHAIMFPGFLTPVLTQLFSHASAEVRGVNAPERKFDPNQRSNSQPPGHESNPLTTEPPGRGAKGIHTGKHMQYM